MQSYQIDIQGTVQGVGFRPFVYALAMRFALNGEVWNDSRGVSIRLNATMEQLKDFMAQIESQKPPLAHIDAINYHTIEPQNYGKFSIVQSQMQNDTFALMPPDVSICDACETELFEPSNRRYGYPFITCTHCGVRYTIIKQLPYDRANTSMGAFEMCTKCHEEYTNPLNRRYHAQPIGCFECGPSLKLKSKSEAFKIAQNKIIEKAVEFILEGKIVAIKGVGGYHLVCDATHSQAVQTLRERKNRPHKPLAIMVKNIESAKQLARVSSLEEQWLVSPQRPIVLLKKHPNPSLVLSCLVAPLVDTIGIFLPYTPLHLLLLKALNRPIVATSANLSDEPLARNFEALMKLAHVWDYCLDHDREILNGCDDSVVTVVQDRALFLRRSRGYAPQAITLPFRLSQKVLALGANQKSTIAIAFEDKAILSPHIGDLDSIDSIQYYHEHIERLRQIYNFQEEIVVHDKHPNYQSTQYAKALATKHPALKILSIQHHVAHIQAIRLEHGMRGKVLGIAFDGTGYGDDGNAWGGEFILCDENHYERVAHLEYFKLLGGDKAIKEPRRVALSLLFECYGEKALDMDNPTTRAFSSQELRVYYRMWHKGLNAPLTSSMGRLFDGVASLGGIIQILSFEGQSGAMMESYYDPNIQSCYLWNLNDGKIDTKPMIKMMLTQSDLTVMISKFFNTLVSIVQQIAMCYPYPVVLGGGVFQNRVLVELLLHKMGKRVFLPQKLPPNDGAIALGQIIQSLSKKEINR